MNCSAANDLAIKTGEQCQECLQQSCECCQPPKTSDKVPHTPKRRDVIQWDDYFMSIAYLTAMRSKDPSTQVGACIVNQDRRIVGIGYNGFPRGCSDDELPWNRIAENELDTKYPVSLKVMWRFFLFWS